jgi:hypothetical protein
MPSPQQPTEIPLGGGPAESVGRLFRGPDVLERNHNARHDKAGYLVKERGTTRIALTITTHGETPEAVFAGLGVDRGELVLVGLSYVYGVAANAPNVDGAALVRRGPSMLGDFEIGLIHTASIGQDT